MSKWLKITNDGEVDARAFTLMGASSKRGDETKIGMFGSGNKYAIAGLLRRGIDITIFSGDKEIVLTMKEVSFRERTVNIIYVNDIETSLTTDMGPQWAVWQCLREFCANAHDEGGYAMDIVDYRDKGEEGKTTIYICADAEEVSDFYENNRKFFLFDETPVSITQTDSYGTISLYKAIEKEEAFYRRGIRCNQKEEQSKPAMFAYNFEDIRINESRIAEYNYEIRERIAAAFIQSNDADVVERFVTSWYRHAETSIAYYNYCASPLSDTWHDVLLSLDRTYIAQNIADSGFVPVDELTNYIILPTTIVDRIAAQFSDVKVAYSKATNFIPAETTEEQQEKLQKALSLFELTIGIVYPIPVEVVNMLDSAICAMYVVSSDKVCISSKHVEDVDVKELFNTLFEEWLHHKGYDHNTREFEAYLIKAFLHLAENVGVKRVKEALNI